MHPEHALGDRRLFPIRRRPNRLSHCVRFWPAPTVSECLSRWTPDCAGRDRKGDERLQWGKLARIDTYRGEVVPRLSVFCGGLSLGGWRRGRDSNPRTPFWGVTRFRVEPVTTTSVPLRGKAYQSYRISQ